MDPSYSVIDSEEAALLPPLDASTAPTTPEGSLSFSPVLAPNMDNVSSALSMSSAAVPVVRNICCVGAGYVGGPTAAVIAFQNPHIRVTVVDNNEPRIRRWISGHPPIYEPGLNEILRIARDGSKECAFVNEPEKKETFDNASGVSTASSECNSQCDHDAVTTVPARQPNLFFSTEVHKSIREADVVLIAVNTPTKASGSGAGVATDMAAFESVTATVAQHARPGAIIVEKSTVPCRTAKMVQDTLAAYRPGIPFEILSNPEFLAAGTAINDLLTAERILIGSSSTPAGYHAAAALSNVYASWIPRTRIVTTNVFSSELAKLVANSMLAQRISSINSIAALCDELGADVDEVAKAIGTDTRIGSKFLKAGIGFGGSCFKKDVLSLCYLAETLGLQEVADYWRGVLNMNEYARDRFAKKVVKALNNTLSGKKVTILGYAFKKDTNDTRESPALEIIRTLVSEAPGEIAVYDPCCLVEHTNAEIRRLVGPGVLKSEGGRVAVYQDAYEACKDSHALMITTDFDEFEYSTAVSSKATPAKAAPQKAVTDPRPFERLEPTESDLLALHKYLVKTSATTTAHDDPLGRFNPLPSCADDCPDCATENIIGSTGYGAGQEYIPKDRLDWAKVGYYMKPPKWVFDGRGVLDIRGMEKLGFRVETVGRQPR